MISIGPFSIGLKRNGVVVPLPLLPPVLTSVVQHRMHSCRLNLVQGGNFSVSASLVFENRTQIASKPVFVPLASRVFDAIDNCKLLDHHTYSLLKNRNEKMPQAAPEMMRVLGALSGLPAVVRAALRSRSGSVGSTIRLNSPLFIGFSSVVFQTPEKILQQIWGVCVTQHCPFRGKRNATFDSLFLHV